MLFWIVPNILLRISFSYPVFHEYFLSVYLGLYATGPFTVVNDIVTQFDKTLNVYYKIANGLKSSFLPY